MDNIENCSGSEKRLSSYYAGAGIVPLGTIGYPAGIATTIPDNGTLALSNFYGSAFRQFSIPNGSFEIIDNIVETDSEIRITGWTIYKRKTRMNGFDTILNYPTPVDPTATYESAPIPYGDDVQLSTLKQPNPVYTARFIDTDSSENWHLRSPSSTGKFILEMSIVATLDGPVSLANPNNFGIVRGPILVNNRAFNLSVGDRIQFLWRAEKNEPIGDKYDVIVYLLEIYSGRTIVILDAKGITVAWQRVRYILSDIGFQGIYKLVFVGGSYDSSGGLSVGAKFFLDEVKIEKAGSFAPFNSLYEPLLGPTSNVPNTAQFTLDSFMQFSVVNAPPNAAYTLTINTPSGSLPVSSGLVDDRGIKIFPTTNLNVAGTYNFSLVFSSNVSQIVSGKASQTLTVTVISNLLPPTLTSPQGFTYLLIPQPTTVMEESLIKYTFRTNDNIDGVYQANISAGSGSYIEFGSETFTLSASQGIRSPKFVGSGFFEHSFFTLAKPLDPGVFQANLEITKNGQVIETSGGSIRVYDISELPTNTPVIASVSPSTGTNGQQITVTVLGSSFIHSQINSMSAAQKRDVTITSVLIFQTQVLNGKRRISTVPAQVFSVNVTSSNNLSFQMPLLPIIGSYDIQLLNQNGAPIGLIKKNAFSITGTSPVITRRSPSRISELGGTKLTLYGYGLTGTSKVTIGGLLCTNITNVSDSEISVITPRYVRKTNPLEEIAILDENYGTEGLTFYSPTIEITTGSGITSSITTTSLSLIPATVSYYFARSPLILKGVENLSINGGTMIYDGITDLSSSTTANLYIDGTYYPCTGVSVTQSDKISFQYPAVPTALRNVESADKLIGSKLRFIVNANFAPANYTSKRFIVDIPVNFYFDVLTVNYTLTRNNSGAVTIPGTVNITLGIAGIPLDSSGTTKIKYRVFGGATLSLSTIVATDVGLTSLEGTFDFTQSSVNYVQYKTVNLTISDSIRTKASLVTFELVGIPNQVLAIPLLV